jgi:hypothetical protein
MSEQTENEVDMSEQEQFFEDCNHIGQGYICEHCVTAKLDAANAEIERLKVQLALHQRFHRVVGCPGGEECYVCRTEMEKL